jgi:hypothetical protein
MESLPEIDFQRIRPHKNTRHGGFEELCVQLFRSKWNDDVELTRVEGAGGDGGVEAYVTLRTGDTIGLQAKYFDKLDSKRWRQIDESVQTALQNHHTLVEYHVAVPLNRSPAQKREWDTRVKQWKRATAKLRRKVDFVWFGASEAEDALTLPKHRDKLLYWFGCLEFTNDWMDQCNAAAISDLDCRHTPQKHVRTECEKLMDALSPVDSSCSQAMSIDLNGGKLFPSPKVPSPFFKAVAYSLHSVAANSWSLGLLRQPASFRAASNVLRTRR